MTDFFPPVGLVLCVYKRHGASQSNQQTPTAVGFRLLPASFAKDALECIAAHGTFGKTLGNQDAKLEIFFAWQIVQKQPGASAHRLGFQQVSKAFREADCLDRGADATGIQLLLTCNQTEMPGRHLSLYRQTGTAFGAAGTQHCAATTCLGANQETVRALTACFGWLVRTFHSKPRTQQGN